MNFYANVTDEDGNEIAKVKLTDITKDPDPKGQPKSFSVQLVQNLPNGDVQIRQHVLDFVYTSGLNVLGLLWTALVEISTTEGATTQPWDFSNRGPLSLHGPSHPPA